VAQAVDTHSTGPVIPYSIDANDAAAFGIIDMLISGGTGAPVACSVTASRSSRSRPA
jgi:hypothetical protein